MQKYVALTLKGHDEVNYDIEVQEGLINVYLQKKSTRNVYLFGARDDPYWDDNTLFFKWKRINIHLLEEKFTIWKLKTKFLKIPLTRVISV